MNVHHQICKLADDSQAAADRHIHIAAGVHADGVFLLYGKVQLVHMHSMLPGASQASSACARGSALSPMMLTSKSRRNSGL